MLYCTRSAPKMPLSSGMHALSTVEVYHHWCCMLGGQDLCHLCGRAHLPPWRAFGNSRLTSHMPSPL